MNNLCVVWDRVKNELSVARPEDVVNINMAALMDNEHGVLLVRTHCDQANAARFIASYSPLLAKHAAKRKAAEAKPARRSRDTAR